MDVDSGRSALSYSHAGITFVMVVGGCIYLGHLADEKYGWTPVGTLIGFAVGFSAGFYQLVRSLGPPKKVPGSSERGSDDAGKDGS